MRQKPRPHIYADNMNYLTKIELKYNAPTIYIVTHTRPYPTLSSSLCIYSYYIQ